MEILREQGWLAGLPAHFAAAVLAQCDLIALARGQLLYVAGDEGGGIYGVVDGRLGVHLPAIDGAATLTHVGGVGLWFGDIAAFGGGERKVSIVAETETRLMRLSRAAMQRITEQDPMAWQYFSRLLAMNFALAHAIITALRCESPVQRVAATLVNLVGGTAGTAAGTADVPVSQTDLGALAKASRSTINMALAELEGRGMVKRHYGKIVIVDLAGLKALY